LPEMTMHVDASEPKVFERRGGKSLTDARGGRIGVERAGAHFVEHASKVGFSHAKPKRKAPLLHLRRTRLL
jgi:hypothetical protein